MLVCIRVVDWEDEDEPASKGEYGWNMPFIYDAIIVHVEEDEDSGEIRKGKVETYLRQSMKYGNNPMWVIRGHERPDTKMKRSELPKPADEVGTETIGRIRWKDGKRPYIVMNKPSAKERKIILDAREELGGDSGAARPTATSSRSRSPRDSRPGRAPCAPAHLPPIPPGAT